MRAVFEDGSVTFLKDQGDPRFHGAKHAKGEHALFRFITRWLNAHGFNLIKKRAQKDGHMVGDEYQPYIRCASRQKSAPNVMILSGFYALHGANEDWNKGNVQLSLETDCFGTGQNTKAAIRDLCEAHPGEMTFKARA